MVLIFQEVLFPNVSGSNHMMQILGSSGKDVCTYKEGICTLYNQEAAPVWHREFGSIISKS